jgi:hypothetical protein
MASVILLKDACVAVKSIMPRAFTLNVFMLNVILMKVDNDVCNSAERC